MTILVHVVLLTSYLILMSFQALCQEHNIPLIKVDCNRKLGEWAGLCKLDAEGKARKVVRCSSVAVRDWGKETPAHDVVQEYIKSQKGQ